MPGARRENAPTHRGGEALGRGFLARRGLFQASSSPAGAQQVPAVSEPCPCHSPWHSRQEFQVEPGPGSLREPQVSFGKSPWMLFP